MHRAYVDKAWIDSFLANQKLSLPEEVSKRFLTVLRIKSTEKVAVFDGHGREVIGTIVSQQGQDYFGQAQLKTHERLKPMIVLIQAAIEESKLSETIKRGSELGVDRFVIFESSRSEPYTYSKIAKKHERFMRMAIDACRQSGRVFIPEIIFEKSLASVYTEPGMGVFGDVQGHMLLSKYLDKSIGEIPFSIVVGPEGGLSDEEKTSLLKMGFVGVVWSPFVLRTELAGVFAVAIFHACAGRA